MAGNEGVALGTERSALESRKRRKLRRIWDWIFGPRIDVGVSRARGWLSFVAVPVFGTVAAWLLYWAILDSADGPTWLAFVGAALWLTSLYEWRQRVIDQGLGVTDGYVALWKSAEQDRAEADEHVTEALKLGRDVIRRNEQLRSAAAAALERTEVEDHEEATAILRGVVTLDGTETVRRYPTRGKLQGALRAAIDLLDADVIDRGNIESLRILAAADLGGEA